ncbi:MAG TPA: amino acid adenylation domain-containing protein [Verrucomicrobiae bacterium]|nr:amino acid adenylation domain-containing protein [Verrucomicrobiae bacterium]
MGTCVETNAADAVVSGRLIERSHAYEPAITERIHQLFERLAASQPGAVALAFEDQQLTYAEVNARANQLAHFLQKRNVGPDSLVGLRVERSAEMILGILGILKAGGAYLPIDPGYPIERQQVILADARVQLVLTQSHLAPIDFDGEIQQLDSDWFKASDEPATDPVCRSGRENLAYIIYTSGSTGKPKGVMVTHGNLLHSTEARFAYYPEPVEKFLLLSSHAFDSSIAGIFWTLCQGGALVLPHEYSRQTASELADLIARHGITHLLCLPSLYAVLLDQFSALGSLKTVIVAGESCPAALVDRHHALLPKATLYNEYGPTEATVWSTVHRCERRPNARTVSIGRAIPGSQVFVLDPQMQPVVNGASGEIYVGGPGVSRGYFNRPELNAKCFVSNPFSPDPHARLYRTGDLARFLPDGGLEFLGRADHQVKIRGHRIELEEIESVLKEHPAVENAVVVVEEKKRTVPVNGEAEQLILRRLSELDPVDAERLLDEIGSAGAMEPANPVATPEGANGHHARNCPEYDLQLTLRNPEFINTPRPSQRTWLLNRLMDEAEADLLAYHTLAQDMVPGAELSLNTLLADRGSADLSEQEILEDWHIPLMRAMARGVTAAHGDILEIGFGRGVAAGFLQDCGVRSHTIIECNDSIISRFFEPWRKQHAGRDIRLVRGKWQDVIDSLDQFDGIFFQTYPLNEKEFAEYLSRSVVFAEHFFPIAAKHLRAGGAFTYLTHEIDSLSRRHQRLILRHFKSIQLSIERLKLPSDCRDLWWSNSMVVATAIK